MKYKFVTGYLTVDVCIYIAGLEFGFTRIFSCDDEHPNGEKDAYKFADDMTKLGYDVCVSRTQFRMCSFEDIDKEIE